VHVDQRLKVETILREKRGDEREGDRNERERRGGMERYVTWECYNTS
jgi:hypothetical protein